MKHKPRFIANKPNPYRVINCKTYLVNIDYISHTKYDNYINSIPNYNKIKEINELYKEGHDIHYWTNRGFDNDKKYNFLTYRQLHEWRVLYCSLSIGKPHFNQHVYELS